LIVVVIKFGDADIYQTHQGFVLRVGDVDLETGQFPRYFETSDIKDTRDNGILNLEINVRPLQKMESIMGLGSNSFFARL
jgi:hypothetical protein